MAVLASAYTRRRTKRRKAHLPEACPNIWPQLNMPFRHYSKTSQNWSKKPAKSTQMLKEKHGNVMWDDNGNIGKRYRRQDEIGTPYCVVIDFDTLEDDTVTVRDRDTTEQKRVEITSLQ